MSQRTSKIVKETIDYISSVRFTIVILIVIVLICAVGTLVGQNLREEIYISRYGHTLYNILSALSITDIYHSIYFNAFLMLLITNIVLCTLKFAPKRMREVFLKGPKRRNYPFSDEIRSKLEMTEAASISKRALRNPLHQLGIEEKKNHVTITSRPHPILNLGALVVHISILFIILGGILSFIFGFSGDMFIVEGGVSNIVISREMRYLLDFELGLKKFTLSRYEDRTPKEYRSDIVFIDDSGETDAVITVNHPAQFRGIRFYQSTFGMAFDKAVVEVIDRSGNSVSISDAYPKIPVVLEDSDLLFVVVDYSPDFRDMGPAVHLFVVEGDKEYGLWTFVNRPDSDDEDGKNFRFILREYYQAPYSGISVVKEPGLLFVWTGFVLICIGFLFPIASSMGSFKVEITKKGKETSIKLFGAPGRIKGNFDERFRRFTEKMRDSLC